MTLKLKRTPGLYLVGFMAAGKTTIGRALAEALGWPFSDVDADIESHNGTTISQIFLERGETAFRELEAAMIRKHVSRIEAGNPRVLALGGGAFVQQINWDLIQNNGVAIWLDCTLETVRKRLGDDNTRPLAADPEQLSKLYEDRRPLYARADFRVEVDTAAIDDIVRQILHLPIF